MKLWIPGAGGLLGSALAKKGDLATQRAEADITNLDSLLAFVKHHPGITHIVNCAAQSVVDTAETQREETFRINAIGPENLALIATKIGARFIHISTDYVFGGAQRSPLKETDPTDPCNYYGFTKLEGEKRVQKAMPSACILRTSWIFGRGGKNFVAKLLRLFEEKETVQLTSDQWGRPTYAPDLADVIRRLFNHSGIYQFANQGAVSKYEFGLAMRHEALQLGLPLKVKQILPTPSSTFPLLAERPVYSAFDTAKIEKELNLVIRPWKEALKEFLCSCSAPSLLSL